MLSSSDKKELIKAITNDDAIGVFTLLKKLNDSGFDINTHLDGKITALHIACLKQSESVIPLLLSAGANPNAQLDSGVTAFQLSCERCTPEAVENMIRHGADLHQKNANIRGSRSLLASLIERGSPIVDTLVYTRAKFTGDELLTAIATKDIQIISKMIPKTKNLEVKERGNPNKETAMHRAISTGQNNVLKMLIAAGADIEIETAHKVTPLMMAASLGNTEAAKMLIAAGADINHRDEVGSTPVFLAALSASADIVKALIKKGADVTLTNEYGQTPLHRCTSVEAAKLLIEAGTALDAKDERGRTALHVAADLGRTELVRFYIDAGLGVNSLTKNKAAPLHGASLGGHKDTATALVELGAKLNTLTKDGYAPIHMAKNVEVVKLLMAAGADPTLKDCNGKDAFLHALERHDADTALFLMEKLSLNPLVDYGGVSLLKRFLHQPKAKEAIRDAQIRWSDKLAEKSFLEDLGAPPQEPKKKAGMQPSLG